MKVQGVHVNINLKCALTNSGKKENVRQFGRLNIRVFKKFDCKNLLTGIYSIS